MTLRTVLTATLVSLTIAAGPASSTEDEGWTWLFKDGSLTLRNCRMIALGNHQRCPMAVACTGFANVRLEGCRFEGFEFTIGYGGGAKGAVTDCLILNPGHCGISVYSGSTVDAVRNIVTGSEYHGVRCTGGTLNLRDNLIIKNKNRGVYLGNKSASGRVVNNVILGNGTGISAFAQTDVVIENNVILSSSYAGLGTRDSCRIRVRDNVFQGNTRGIVQFEATGKSQVEVGRNSFWKNETNTENLEMPDEAILTDPDFAALENGDFVPRAQQLTDHRQGLRDAAVFENLWKKWKSEVQERGRNEREVTP